MEVGTELPTITKRIDQPNIDAYAEAAGDFNPIHLDNEFAKTTQFGGTIAHGMMVAAILSELLSNAHKLEWPRTGKLKIRFKAPVKPGETVTAYGTVKQAKGHEITYSVGIRNQDAEDVITGEATLTIA